MKVKKYLVLIALMLILSFSVIPSIQAGLTSLPFQDDFDAFEDYWTKGGEGDSQVADGHWNATDYGSGTGWHGPSIQVNFSNEINPNEDFYVTINVTASSDNGADVTCQIWVYGYNETGECLFWVGWADSTSNWEYGYIYFRDDANDVWIYNSGGQADLKKVSNLNLTIAKIEGDLKAFVNGTQMGTTSADWEYQVKYIKLVAQVHATRTEPEYMQAELCYADRIDAESPTYNFISVNNTIVGRPVQFRCNFSDNMGLSGFMLEHNNSGTVTNETWSSNWVDETWAAHTLISLNDTTNLIIAVRFFANDTKGNWCVTPYFSITTRKSAVAMSLIVFVIIAFILAPIIVIIWRR